VIRRGFWLIVGAALGVTGYRKATRFARALTSQPVPRRAKTAAAGLASAAGFAADVRDGMAEYWDSRRTLGSPSQQAPEGTRQAGRDA
jgi:hypothetical protein